MEKPNPFKENIVLKYLPDMKDLVDFLPAPQSAKINTKSKEFALTYDREYQGSITKSPWTDFFRNTKEGNVYPCANDYKVKEGESLSQCTVVLTVGKVVTGKIIPHKKIIFNKNHIKCDVTYTQWEGKTPGLVEKFGKKVKNAEKPTRIFSGSFKGLNIVKEEETITKYQAQAYFFVSLPKQDVSPEELQETAIEWNPTNNKK